MRRYLLCFVVVVALLFMVPTVAAQDDDTGLPQNASEAAAEANETEDISDQFGVNLPPGKRMNLVVTEFAPERAGQNITEASFQADGGTVSSFTIRDVPLNETAYLRIYRDRQLAALGTFPEAQGTIFNDFVENEIRPALSGTDELTATDTLIAREILPLAYTYPDEDRVELFVYSTTEESFNSDFGHFAVRAVSNDNPTYCELTQIKVNDEGQVVSVKGDGTNTSCDEKAFEIRSANFTWEEVNNQTQIEVQPPEFNYSEPPEYETDIPFLANFSNELRADFDGIAGSYDVNESVSGNVTVTNPTASTLTRNLTFYSQNEQNKQVIENTGDVTISNDSSTTIQLSFTPTQKGSYTVYGTEKRNSTDTEKTIGRTRLYVFGDLVDDGDFGFDITNQPTYVSYLTQINLSNASATETFFRNRNQKLGTTELPTNLTATDEVILSQDNNEYTYEYNLSAFEDGSLLDSLDANRSIATNSSSYDSVEVEIVDFRYYKRAPEDSSIPGYKIIPGGNGTLIPPNSTITPNGTIAPENPFLDLPNNGSSYRYEICDGSFARPAASNGTSSVFLDANTEVILQPNTVVVSDLGGETATNSTYNYPSTGDVNITAAGQKVVIEPEGVRVPGCAFVLDLGSGATLPVLRDEGTFEFNLNTYYLNTETRVGASGLVEEYIDNTTDKETVSGVSFRPVVGNATFEITQSNRAQSDVFGASVFRFTLSREVESVPMTVQLSDLDPNRQYTLYSDDEIVAQERTGDNGAVSFDVEPGTSETEYVVVAGQQVESFSAGGGGGSLIPQIDVGNPSIVLLFVTALFGAASAYLYYRNEQQQTSNVSWAD